ncbi:unnamed protein product [Meloidogyne enterolobii]|uniref:Uncharacterized protein n=1 Tax=Meloidogyne enterolobii TaxID=390850 RepID=A0ACB0XSH2_MELEN
MIKDKNISINVINTKRRTKSCESFKNDEKEDENENENRRSLEEIWDEVTRNRQKGCRKIGLWKIGLQDFSEIWAPTFRKIGLQRNFGL